MSLNRRNPNIRVIRHPHRSVVGGEFLWSHHEKIVCIDQQTAFIGGLDLCYGRWDNQQHSLVDTGPVHTWNGIDYNNARYRDFVEVDKKWNEDGINRNLIPRMPWHDVSVKVVGKVAYDVGIHFIELWNNVMTDITGNMHRRKDLLQPVEGTPLKTSPKRISSYQTVWQAPQSPLKSSEQILMQEVQQSDSEEDPVAEEGIELFHISLQEAELQSLFTPPKPARKSTNPFSKKEKNPFTVNESSPEGAVSDRGLDHELPRQRYQASPPVKSVYSLEPNIEKEDWNKAEPLRQSLPVIEYLPLGASHIDVQKYDSNQQYEVTSNAIPLESWDIEEEVRQTLLSSSPSPPKRRMRKYSTVHEGRSNPFDEQDALRPSWASAVDLFQPDVSAIEEHELAEEQDEQQEIQDIEKKYQEGDEMFASTLLIPQLRESKIKSKGTWNCQVIRSCGTWSHGLDQSEHSIRNAYIELIDQANHFIYIENQFFISNTAGKPVKNEIAQVLVERIIIAAQRQEKFKVIVMMPLLPAFEGSVDDPNAAVLRVQLYWEYMTIWRSTKSIYSQLAAEPSIQDPTDYIKFYGVRSHGMLDNNPVTELIYVHSKMMIVDDNFLLIGSANINDRSLLGKWDSEINLVIDDDDKVPVKLNGREILVSRLVHEMRMNIFEEHSGAVGDSRLVDPLSDEFAEVWDKLATNNTMLYREVFRWYPDDLIRTIKEFKEFENKKQLDQYGRLVKEVRGNIVDFPLQFLADEDLRIKVFNMEYYVPDESFI